MADICIIYCREDARHLPQLLEKLLIPEFTVWWDRKINHGQYRREILKQLRRAGCVVPIWSPLADSSVATEEAEHARDFEVPLLPILTHEGRAPLGFNRDQMTTAIGWNGESEHPAIREHIEKIRVTLDHRRGPKLRPQSLGNRPTITLPAYFFSLSSYETKISPEQGIQALDALHVKSVLVSAQNTLNKTSRTRFMNMVRRIRKSGGVILLDSGNYEEGRVSKLEGWSHRSKQSNEATWTITDYHRALRNTPHDMAFCFDDIESPPNNLEKIVARVIRAVERDRKFSEQPILPIVHLPYDQDGNVIVKDAPDVVVRVANRLDVPMIGIPERELGEGMIARVDTMRRIRAALNRSYKYQAIHVLGTGDPIALALLAVAGADSFDGLEWCRYVLDGETARVYPIQDYDFFRWQDDMSPYISPLMQKNGKQDLTWLGQVAVHNVEFYLNWTERLRVALSDEKRVVAFLTKLLPKEGMADVWPILWGDK